MAEGNFNAFGHDERQYGIDLSEALTGLLDQAIGCLEKDHIARDCLDRAYALLSVDRRQAGRNEPGGTGKQILAPWQALRVKRFIESHLESTIKTEELIGLTRLSTSYFFRAFKGSFGVPPHAYIVKRRLDRARHLLLTTDEQLCQIALACGLADQAHLSRMFRQQTGLPPGVWRRQMRGGIVMPG